MIRAESHDYNTDHGGDGEGVVHAGGDHSDAQDKFEILTILQQPKLCLGTEHGICASSHGLKQVRFQF